MKGWVDAEGSWELDGYCQWVHHFSYGEGANKTRSQFSRLDSTGKVLSLSPLLGAEKEVESSAWWSCMSDNMLVKQL